MSTKQKNYWPLVSVIIPFYNVKNYIKNTLESVNNQVYKNIEIILVNDGSTDNSLKVVKEFLSKCKFKYTLYSQKNSGVSAARNKGLSLSSGEYVVFVDSDDLLSPQYINKMYETIKENDFSMVICGFNTFRDDGLIYRNKFIIEEPDSLASIEIMNRFLTRKIKISIWSLMVKKDVIEKYKIRFASGYKYSEDMHFIWKLLAHVERVGVISSPLYYYRWRDSSAMANFNDSRLDGLYLMKDIEKYYEKYCKDFAKKFKKYGIARWVWATLWQSACALSYNEFKYFSNKIMASAMMKKLEDFPDIRVRLSSKIYRYNNYLYYLFIRKIAQLKDIKRINNNRILYILLRI